MRVYGLLLGISAHSLLAGTIGACISLLVLNVALEEAIDLGPVGLKTACVFAGVGVLSLIVGLTIASSAQRASFFSCYLRWLGIAAIMVIPTAMFFGPTSGFHHMIGFGQYPFFYMVWNGEDPAPGSFQIMNGFEVWFNPLRFGLYVTAWFAILVLLARSVKPMQTRSKKRSAWERLREWPQPRLEEGDPFP